MNNEKSTTAKHIFGIRTVQIKGYGKKLTIALKNAGNLLAITRDKG